MIDVKAFRQERLETSVRSGMLRFLSMFSDRTNWKLTRNRLTETLEEVHSSGAEVLDLTLSNPTQGWAAL